MKLRRTKEITLVILAAIAAAACEESKQAEEDLKHCVDENGVVQDESKCHDAPVQPPTGSDGGPAHHSGGGGGHGFFWYYGGTRAPVSPGGKVTGGSYAPSPGKSYAPPSISKGGFGGTGKSFSSPGGHGGGGE